MSIDLVTGGNGFIGHHLVMALHARGEAVRVLDPAPATDFPHDVEVRRGSILDRAALDDAMKAVRRVYHLAGIAKLWTKDKADYQRINADGTANVLAASAAAGVERVVHCSTEAVLLPHRRSQGTPVDEIAPPELAHMPGPYTRSKLLAEQAVFAAVRAGMDAVIVSPTVPIGPGDHNLTPPAAMLALFLQGKSPAFLNCLLNLVDVRDVAAGMILAAERGRSGERYVLGGENIALRELLARLEQISGRPMPRRAIPGWLALASAGVTEWIADHWTGRPPAATVEGVRLALMSAPFDSARARNQLGYAPRPLRPALQQAVDWLSTAGRLQR